MVKQDEDERIQDMSFCDCGEAIITACQHCQSTIKSGTKRPARCGRCGKPFPWTERALQAAKDYTDQIQGLSPEDKIDLKESFTDLTKDTANTPVAANKFIMYVKKMGPIAGDNLLKIMVNVMTQVAIKRFKL
jgi:hypothetical protein